ncbi:MAG TPA: nucleotidyltransferase domain-containing protein [Woeseiaceae bacterium]|nr:nucleotidyltransferase domain-containing protein [Woeseiaceae bacterium]
MTFEFSPKDRVVTLRMAEPLLQSVKAKAARAGMPYQRFIRQVLERALEQESSRHAPNRETIVRTLRTHQGELQQLGVAGLSLFGSVARGEATPDSDVDVAITVDRNRMLSLLDVGGIQDRLQELLRTQTGIVVEPAKKRAVQQEIERDRVRVF